MPTIGETLKAAREARGLSLPEAGQATRIKTQQLDAIERDDYRTIPAAPYARGFIKLYAQFLHLDPAPLLEQYNIRHGKSVPPPAPTPTTPSRPRPPAPAPVKPAPAPAAAAPAPAATPPVPSRAIADLAPAPVQPAPAAAVSPEPVRESYIPILPVAGVNPAPVPASRPDELPLLDAPQSTPVPSPEPVIPDAPVPAPAEVTAPEFPAFPTPVHAVAPEADLALPAPAPEPERLELSAPPADLVRRDAEDAADVVERFAPPSAADDRIEAARRADRQLRLRQAMLVVVAVLVFAGVLWLIRKLVRDAAPDASELSGINARSRGLVAPPPEPYLEGR